MDNDNQTGITKIAHFVYTLTLGKVISTSEPKEDLVLEQGVRKLFEDKADNDFDDITEARCKQCRYYDMCHRHGRDYNCKDYRRK